MSSLLEVSGVSVSFDGFKAINNLSFRIGNPELRAIIGPRCWETTLDIITGKTKPRQAMLWAQKILIWLDYLKQIAQLGVDESFKNQLCLKNKAQNQTF